MNPEQITLVQEGFRKVQAIRDTAAELFYARLFTLDPSLKSLFDDDMKQQGRKLMAAIAFVVQGEGRGHHARKFQITALDALGEVAKRRDDTEWRRIQVFALRQ